MKKHILAFVMLATVSMTACGSETKAEETTVAKETVAETGKETIEPKPTGYFSTMPDPELIFPNSNLTILNNNPGWYVIVDAPGEGEFEEYLDASEEAGMTDIAYQFEDDRSITRFVYDVNHDYYAQISYMKEWDRVDIVYTEVGDDTND